MSEVSLYRKYRPHNFDNLVGQDHVKQTLINAIKTDHIAHAYLFTGPRGTGKTSTARLIAKALNCQNLKDDFEPCNECELCKDIATGRLIDLIEIDAASNRGIDEVRDLKEKINFAPSRSKYKVYIIDEVHMMTKEAFNALLKTLEEPPSHAYFILATTEVHKIPETIISRCQRFDFRRINSKALLTRLSYISQKEDIKAEDEALAEITKYADGGLRDAIGLLEQLTTDNKLTHQHVHEMLGITSNSLLENLLSVLKQNDTKAALGIVHDLHSNGSDLNQFIHDFLEVLRLNMLESVNTGSKAETGRLIGMIEDFKEAQGNLLLSIPQLALEIAVIKITGGLQNAAPTQKVEVASPAAVEAAPAAKMEKPVEKAKPVENVVKDTITPQAQEIPEKDTPEIVAAPGATGLLDLATVREKWPRVTERISTPSLRMSLKNGTPVKVDGPKILLEFSTNFHKNKVVEHDHRVELEGALKESLGQAMKVTAIVKSLEIKPVTEQRPAEAHVSSEPVAEAKSDMHIDQALEIFGGELVD
jgi:DNA polymerase III subunit gamma/tau